MNRLSFASLTLALLPGIALAETPAPAADLAGLVAKASTATSAVHLVLDSKLSAQLPRLSGDGPLIWDGWHLERNGWTVESEELAESLYRGAEFEQYPKRIGSTATHVGLWVAAASATAMLVMLPVSASGGNEVRVATETVYGISGATLGAGLITALIGAVAHSLSDREIPLRVGAELVADYNTSPEAPRPSQARRPPATPAPVVVEAKPRPAPLPAPVQELTTIAPASSATAQCGAAALGITVLDSDGLRIAKIAGKVPGVERGDVLVAVGGISVTSESALDFLADHLRAGESVPVELRRKGKKVETKLIARGCAQL